MSGEPVAQPVHEEQTRRAADRSGRAGRWRRPRRRPCRIWPWVVPIARSRAISRRRCRIDRDAGGVQDEDGDEQDVAAIAAARTTRLEPLTVTSRNSAPTLRPSPVCTARASSWSAAWMAPASRRRRRAGRGEDAEGLGGGFGTDRRRVASARNATDRRGAPPSFRATSPATWKVRGTEVVIRRMSSPGRTSACAASSVSRTISPAARGA